MNAEAVEKKVARKKIARKKVSRKKDSEAKAPIGIYLRNRVAANLRRLIREQRRTHREVAKAAWPELSLEAAERRLERILAAKTEKSWISEANAEALGRALGVDPEVFFAR